MINKFPYFLHMKIQMVISDLDGTLLNSHRVVSNVNLEMLNKLGEKNIPRVIATGRNLYSLRKVILRDFPVDYVVFSSGCGIIDWKTQELLFAGKLEASKVRHLSELFINDNIDFMCHAGVPENHYFHFYHNGNDNPDFFRRLKLYKSFQTQIKKPIEQDASQFLAVLPENSEKVSHYQKILKDINVIRTTSPLDHRSVWMEVFHKDISKSKSCQKICNMLGIDTEFTLSVGNDYNDLDLLNWSKYSYVVENSPDIMKKQFINTSSNDNDGFAEIFHKNYFN